jgi:hypothetical protein
MRVVVETITIRCDYHGCNREQLPGDIVMAAGWIVIPGPTQSTAMHYCRDHWFYYVGEH